MKDPRSILILLLATVLLAFLAFYIYDKSRPAASHKLTYLADSTAFKEAVKQAVEDSLRKRNISQPDTAFLSKDSLVQKPAKNSSNNLSTSDSTFSLNTTPVEKKGKNKATNSAKYFFNVTRVSLEAMSKKTVNKPESTSLAKETNKFVLTFTLQNKILSSGVYTVYVVIIKPDQRVLRSNNTDNDYFIAAKEGPKLYTKKIHFSYIRKSRKAITCVVNNVSFSPGVYTVQIYFNGKKIGESTSTLTKGGLLG